MKKLFFNYLLIISIMFCILCGCSKEKILNPQDAALILQKAKIPTNVEVITTTETMSDGIKSLSTQKEIYYNDKYYKSTISNYSTTQTWYGIVDNSLCAFYYSKNANNKELKNSSKIEHFLLESTKYQLNSVINDLFDERGYLLSKYNINGKKKSNTYTIKISSSSDIETRLYSITITNDKVTKIIKISTIFNDSIKITHSYNYNVSDFKLPTLSEYPLMING